MRISRIPAEAGKALEPRRDGKTAHNLQQTRYLAIISRRLAPLNEKWGKSSDFFLTPIVFRSRTWEKLERIWDTAEQRSHRARSLQVAFLLSETALHQ